MGRPIVPTNAKILNAQAMAATFVSPVIDTWQADAVSWEGVVTGTTGASAGTFSVEGSNQYDKVTNPTPTFIAQPATTPALPAVAGANVSFLVTSPGVAAGGGAARYQRLRYTRTGGDGVLNLWAVGVGRS